MENKDSPDLLEYKIDRYHAATFNSKLFPEDVNQFDKMLEETMKHLIKVINLLSFLLYFSSFI